MLVKIPQFFIEIFYPRVIEAIVMVMVIVCVIIELIINTMKILHIRHKMLVILAGHCCNKVTNMYH